MRYFILFIMLLPSLALADFEEMGRGVYLRVDGGMTVPLSGTETDLAQQSRITFKKRPIFSAGVGYRLNNILRADINFQHRKLDVNKIGSLGVENSNIKGAKSQAIFLNGYLDLTTHDYITPYFTAGAGYGKNKVKSFSKSSIIGLITQKTTVSNESKYEFIWNVGFGTRIKMQKNFELDLAYKYTKLGNTSGRTKFYSNNILSTESKFTIRKIRAHELTAGLLINF